MKQKFMKPSSAKPMVPIKVEVAAPAAPPRKRSIREMFGSRLAPAAPPIQKAEPWPEVAPAPRPEPQVVRAAEPQWQEDEPGPRMIQPGTSLNDDRDTPEEMHHQYYNDVRYPGRR